MFFVCVFFCILECLSLCVDLMSISSLVYLVYKLNYMPRKNLKTGEALIHKQKIDSKLILSFKVPMKSKLKFFGF